MGVGVPAEFLVYPPRPLFPSDVSEFNLIEIYKNRMKALPEFSDTHQAKNTKKISAALRVLEPFIRWFYLKFPKDSIQKRLAQTLVHMLPLYYRNQIYYVIFSSKINSNSSKNIVYSQDQGFGLHTSTKPLVTIVIPVYNNWQTTYNCLLAFRGNSNSTPYEIIIVDDASTDQTTEALQNIRGVTVVRNLTNTGYLISTNRGAAQASTTSKYILLLNNDTEPIGDWLDSLYKTIEKDETIAIVGSTLIYPNGILQEAGGQIFTSGNAWNLGRGSNPFNNLFTFTREVDYCSAAAAIVRKTFWIDVGGFDTRYVPAYCEDSDLALAAWSKGYRVIYEPKSWVIHHEGLSHDKSIVFGKEINQIANNRKLFAKWESNLRNHWEDLGKPRLEATRESKGIVVVCDRQLPALSRDAGSIRTVQIIQHIQALGYHVILVCLDQSSTMVDIDILRSRGVEVHQNSEEFYATLDLRRERVRAIWTIRQEVYDHFEKRLKQIAPSSIFIADLMDIKYREEYNPKSGVANSQLRIADEVTHIVLVSEVELQEFNEQSKTNKASVVWSEYEPKNCDLDWNNSNGLVFVGGFRHLPNLEGIQWFADEVLPLLNKMEFKAPIRVIGSGLDVQKTAELNRKGLQILGGIEDLSVIYKQSRIAIVPLLRGAGRKGKIGEALSYGIPIVSTTVGIKGFNDIVNAGVSVADSPQEMAKVIFDLHEDLDLWTRASILGKDYCKLHLSSMAMRRKISQLISVELMNDEQ